MDAISIGPFAIPIGPLLTLAALLLALAIAKKTGRANKVDVEPQLWTILFAGVVTARAVFVALYFQSYKDSPWKILDIRDGGFIATAGVLAVLAMTIWFARRSWPGRKPLLLSTIAGMMFWLIGSIATIPFLAGSAHTPTASLSRLDGTPVTLDAYAGKPMVVNMWATWCPPCRREMPVLRDAQARNKDVVFVFVNQGESAATISRYLEEQGLALENVLLDRSMVLGSETGSRALPTTLFFDAQGALADRRMGELSEATLAQRIDRLREARR